MYNCGSYPGLVESPAHGVAIEGELWEVDASCLAGLDEIEGISAGLYRRGPIRLQPPFDTEHVQTYFYLRSVSGLPDCGSGWRDDQ